jgi:putative ABC transport system permease protein
LKSGVTIASAVAELNAIKQNLSDTYPAWKDTWGAGTEPLHSALARDTKPFLLMLFGATALVLLIACANVANLLLARATVRRREIAVRAALGASGRRILRQLLTESVLLALLGGIGGVLIAAAAVRLLGSLSAGLIPATMTPQLDLRVLGFSLLVSCGTGLVFGLFPGWRSRRPELNHALKSGSTGTTDGGRNRSQSALVIAEVALTAVLLVATGMLVRGMVKSVSADPGIDPTHVLTFELTPPFGGTYGNPQTRLAFFERALTEMRALPGVISAASTDDLPYGDDGQGYFFSLE